MNRSHTPRMVGLVPALAAAALLCTAAAAGAHVQVTPTTAAPNDPVHFRFLVPGESEAETTKVEIKVPADVLPFSYGDIPGWKRTVVEAPNGAVDRIVWTGRMAKDGFAEFSFLAGTPEVPATLTWKALQTYSDGQIVRWIGEPGSEHPAPVTQVERGAPPQNAGGEGAEGSAGAASATGGTTTTVTATATPSAGRDDSADAVDWVTRGIALAALFAGLAAIVLGTRSRTAGRGHGG